MSASNSPRNPGQTPRPPKNPAAPTTLRRVTPALLAGGATLAAVYAYYSNRPAAAPNPMRTPGVKNIEASFRGGGATGTHTPAYGGTVQGQRDSETFRGDAQGTTRKEGAEQVQSAGKRDFDATGPNGGKGEADIGEAQRPASMQATGPGKMWNKMKFGNEDQK